MMIWGKTFKDAQGMFWLIEIPLLGGLATQANSKAEVEKMAKDAVECLTDDPAFKVNARLVGNRISIEANDQARMSALILKELQVMPSKPEGWEVYEKDFFAWLKNPEHALSYLKAVLDEDAQSFFRALRDVVKAQVPKKIRGRRVLSTRATQSKRTATKAYRPMVKKSKNTHKPLSKQMAVLVAKSKNK